MKKITLTLGLIMSLMIASFAQENPCPSIISHGFTNVSTSGTTCTSKVYVYATGDIASQKGLGIQVYLGTVNGTLLTEICHIVPKNSPSTYYETPEFSAPCDATITYVITRYTASNGSCGGGTCGQTFTIDGGPLPIKMNAFYAKRNNATINLVWETASEVNAKEFVIQRKINGSFQEIATVAAQNAVNGAKYSYTDNNTVKGVSEYRIKLVDQNSQFAYSEIRSVKGTSTVSDFTVYPNPSMGNVKVTVSDISEPTDVHLIDNSGRIIKNISMNNANTIDLSNLQKGMYMIRIVNKTTGESLTKKLTVIN